MNGFNSTEIIDLSTVRVENGKFLFNFTCPRCGHAQCASMNEQDLIDGKTFHCSNSAICGKERNMHMVVNGITRIAFGLRIDDITADDVNWGSGGYQDNQDAPLNK